MNNPNPKIFFTHFRNVEAENPSYKTFREKIIINPKKQCYFWAYTNSIIQPNLCVYDHESKRLTVYDPLSEEVIYLVNNVEHYFSFYRNIEKLFKDSNIVPGYNITRHDFYFYNLGKQVVAINNCITTFSINFDLKNNRVICVTDYGYKEEIVLNKNNLWKFIFNHFNFEYSFEYDSEGVKNDRNITISKTGFSFKITVSAYNRYSKSDGYDKDKIFTESSYLLTSSVKTFTLFSTNQDVTNEYLKYVESMMKQLLSTSKDEWSKYAEVMAQEIEQDIPFKDWSILK
jgi:hypothetical protein